MQQPVIALSSIVQAIKNRRYLIGNIFLGAIMIALLINFLIPPIYEAETTLRVKQSKGLLSSTLLSDMTGSPLNDKQLMSTYSEILKSRTVVQSMIDKMQSDESEVPKYEDMLKRITTQQLKDTEILKIKVTGKSPSEAQLLANTLVDSFNGRLITLVRSEQSAVREFIGERVGEARKELDRSEKALEQYKRDQKILTPSDETKAMVERMAYMKKLSADNAVAAAMAGGKLNSVDRQLAQESPSLIADSPLIQLYKAKLADLEVELVSLSQNFGNKHPKVMAIHAAIDETRVRLDRETNQVIHSQAPSLSPIHQRLLLAKIENEAELSAATAQKAAIGRVMAESEQELIKLPAKEQGISRLNRDVMVAQEIYIMLANRYEEARISEVAQPADVQVIDVAVPPEIPISPRKALNLVVGGILGLVLGLGLALFLEHSQGTIQNSQDAKRYLGLPVLGVMPDFSLSPVGKGLVGRMQAFFGKNKQFAEDKKQNRKVMMYREQLILSEKPKSPMAEAYRSFRTNLQYSKVDGGVKSILFTSSGPGEGKSVTAANTAIALAQGGAKVIIMDCDLRRPVQHLIFGRMATGITNILAGKGTIREYLQDTDIPNLKLLASGPIPPNPAELFNTNRMNGIIALSRAHTDYLIIDAPPVLPVTDTCVLASKVDGIILVLGAGIVRPEAAERARKALDQVKGFILGVMVNRVKRDEVLEDYSSYSSMVR